MAGLGMYEGYTHLLNLFLTRPESPEDYFREAREYLSSLSDAEGGITELMEGDFASGSWDAEPSAWKKNQPETSGNGRKPAGIIFPAGFRLSLHIPVVPDGQLRPVPQMQLIQNTAEIIPHRSLSKTHDIRDLPVG